MNKKQIKNGQFAVHEPQRLIIKGVLNSRIEKKGTSDPYYYGFFQIEGWKEEIPVIFKGIKPAILKGSQAELEGA